MPNDETTGIELLICKFVIFWFFRLLSLSFSQWEVSSGPKSYCEHGCYRSEFNKPEFSSECATVFTTC